jgi:hypothetical protein
MDNIDRLVDEATDALDSVCGWLLGKLDEKREAAEEASRVQEEVSNEEG